MASAWGSSWAGAWGVSWGDSGVSPPVVVPAAAEVGHSGRRRRTRYVVRYRGREVEVATEAQFNALVAAAEQRVRERAQKAAAKAVARAEPPAIRAPEWTAPRLELVAPDFADQVTQQLQARIDAANASLAAAYQHEFLAAQMAQQIALADAARARMLEDEDDVAMLLAMGHL